MKERPIICSAPMIRALLDGTKWQTRRVCKPAEKAALSYVVEVPDPLERGQVYNGSRFGDEEGGVQFACLYGGVGERLWVRETFDSIYPQDPSYNGGKPIEYDYRATYKNGDRLGDLIGPKKKWTPAIHMPRAASRIELQITGVRVERLHDISEADAKAEGVSLDPRAVYGGAAATSPHRHEFFKLWEQLYGAGSWDANPWMWVIEFRRIKP